MSEQQTFRQKIDRVREMLDPAFDWKAYWETEASRQEDDLEDLVSACITVGFPEGAETARYIECGSAPVADTPRALYRLLWLLKPQKPLDFSGMYKAYFTGFFSADKRFFVAVHFFKYELGLYFYCPREAWQASPGAGVVVNGAPGADNGWRCADEDGLAFFDMVVKAVNTRWLVYAGNHFEV